MVLKLTSRDLTKYWDTLKDSVDMTGARLSPTAFNKLLELGLLGSFEFWLWGERDGDFKAVVITRITYDDVRDLNALLIYHFAWLGSKATNKEFIYKELYEHFLTYAKGNNLWALETYTNDPEFLKVFSAVGGEVKFRFARLEVS